MPTLVRELHTEFAVVQWVVLAYLLTITSTMAGIGRIADMVGKKSIYMSGFIIFTLGSALCGFSPSVNWLIGFRVLQAIGAAMTMALGAAIVTEAFPPAERGKAMGIIGAIVSIGIIPVMLGITSPLAGTLGQTVGIAVIGAIWADRTIFYAGTKTSGGATMAPIDAQIAGLHDAFLTAAVLTGIALLLSIRAYLQETR